jgi:hypothetical protein
VPGLVWHGGNDRRVVVVVVNEGPEIRGPKLRVCLFKGLRVGLEIFS